MKIPYIPASLIRVGAAPLCQKRAKTVRRNSFPYVPFSLIAESLKKGYLLYYYCTPGIDIGVSLYSHLKAWKWVFGNWRACGSSFFRRRFFDCFEIFPVTPNSNIYRRVEPP
ncbi:unnamed protein product, partial [Laminaria digitata]